MALNIRAGSNSEEIGAPLFVHAFFPTISAQTEPEGWGSRLPHLLNELDQGKLSHRSAAAAAASTGEPGSIWSAVNIANVARLAADQRMTAAGHAAFARRSETKSLVYSHEQVSVPALRPGERAVFQENKAAWAFFEARFK